MGRQRRAEIKKGPKPLMVVTNNYCGSLAAPWEVAPPETLPLWVRV